MYIFMEYFALSIIIISLICYYAILRKRRNVANTDTADKETDIEENDTQKSNDKLTDDDSTDSTPDFTGMKPHELSKALLRELNCKVVEDEDDKDRMGFSFQGETFCLIASNDCLLVTVYDFSWGSVSLDDLDEVSRLRKTINNINFRFGGLCVIYTMDTDHNKMVVHTKRQFLLTPEIPNIVEYMTAMLTGFFDVQRALTHELDLLRMGKAEE